MSYHLPGSSSKTTVDCRELVEEVMLRDSENGKLIGGVGKVVEIDKSKF